MKGTIKDKKLSLDKCLSMKISEIRQTTEYAALTPLGKKNKSGHYKYGNKSYLNKKELCLALDDPLAYHAKILELKNAKKNAGPRKRKTRTGSCPTKRKIPCKDKSHPYPGLSTTGKPCCYKVKQSKKVTEKRSKKKEKKMKT